MALFVPYDTAEPELQIEPDANGEFSFQDMQHLLGHEEHGRWVRAVIQQGYRAVAVNKPVCNEHISKGE